MSSSIKQNLASDQVVRINDFDLLGLVQSFDWQPNLGAEEDFELGNKAKVGTSYEGNVTASIALKATGNLPGIMARFIEQRDATTDVFQGYQFASGGASGKNAYTFTQDDLAFTRADIILHERPDGKLFSRSTWLPRMQLSSISGSVSATGAATESLNFSGSDDVGFPKGFHDIRSVPATVTDATHIQLADVTVGTSTHTLAYVMVNNERFRNQSKSGTDETTFTLGASGVVTMSSTAGYVMPADADVHALVYKTVPSTTFPSLTSSARGTTATSVRGNKVNIYIAPTDENSPVASEKWLCAQSLDWSVPLGLSDLNQIEFTDRNSSTYTRVVNFPLSLSITTNVYETDWHEWQTVLNGTFTGLGGSIYDNTYEFAPNSIKTGFAIVLDYFTKGGSRLCRLTFSDMSPSGRGKRVGVPGRSEVQWGFSGTKVKIQGFNV
jgi:hypothetical protein